MPLKLWLEQIRYAVGEGAGEIDIVITRAHVLGRDWSALYDLPGSPHRRAKYLDTRVDQETTSVCGFEPEIRFSVLPSTQSETPVPPKIHFETNPLRLREKHTLVSLPYRLFAAP
jgi:hypothetical protein